MSLIFISCGTIDGIYQQVDLDSEPRGMEVFSGEGDEAKSIGHTPLFYELRRRSEDVLTFKAPGHTGTIHFDCDFRWLVEGVGHGALAFVDWQIAFGATIVDLLVGSAYQCPEAHFYQAKSPIKMPEVNYCRRYLVVPPRGLDLAVADSIAKNWTQNALFQLRGCDDFLPYRANRGYLDSLNLNRTKKEIPDVDSKKLSILGYETSATHLAILSAQKDGGGVGVSAVAYDLHRNVSVPMTGFKQKLEGMTLKKPEPLLGTIPVSFDLFPNAMANGASVHLFEASGNPGYHLRGASRTMLNRNLSRVSFLSVTHPFGFEEWDFNTSIASSIVFFTDNFKWQRQGTSEEVLTSITQMAPIYYFDVSVHTPAGAFSAGVGGGLYLGVIDTDGRRLKGEAGLLAATRFAYTAFLTEKIFGQISVSAYRSAWRSYQPDPYRLSDSFATVAAMIGVYLPDLRKRY